ncbi:hypothetical protein FOFC_03035 [Fusarium oxysporum]|nr:hypothetical protein FOFC_03035 [Fusarium oxysporum]
MDHDSDHLPIVTSLDLNTVKLPVRPRRNWKALDEKMFFRALQRELPPQQRPRTKTALDRRVGEMMAAITAAIEEAVPKTTSSPWSRPGWNEECTEALAESKLLRRQHSLYHTEDTWEAYRMARNYKGKVIKKAFKQIHRLLRRYDIQYDPKVHRLRCQGQIINLAAKTFLFVTDNEKLERDDSDLHNVTLKHIEAWRKKGPLGRLHNFVVYIQRSVQRSQKFLAISHNRRLARDNDTRWSSWHTMLRAALNLKDAIDGYFNKWMDADCAGDELSLEDWIILEKIKSFLEKLKMTTKALESSFATLGNVLLVMDFALAQFEGGKEAAIDDPVMAPMYNSGWAKLDKYYRLTEESPAYVAAIVLHPSHKWHYIQENWKKEWAES